MFICYISVEDYFKLTAELISAVKTFQIIDIPYRCLSVESRRIGKYNEGCQESFNQI